MRGINSSVEESLPATHGKCKELNANESANDLNNNGTVSAFDFHSVASISFPNTANHWPFIRVRNVHAQQAGAFNSYVIKHSKNGAHRNQFLFSDSEKPTELKFDIDFVSTRK